MTEQEIYEYLRDLTEKYPIVFHSPHYRNGGCGKGNCPICTMDIKLYDMVLELKRERKNDQPV